MTTGYPSWVLCAPIDAAQLERLAKRDLSYKWSVAAGNDGHVALFVYRSEPSFRFAQCLAAELGEPVVVLNFDDDLYCADQVRADGSEHRLAEKPATVLSSHGIARCSSRIGSPRPARLCAFTSRPVSTRVCAGGTGTQTARSRAPRTPWASCARRRSPRRRSEWTRARPNHTSQPARPLGKRELPDHDGFGRARAAIASTKLQSRARGNRHRT